MDKFAYTNHNKNNPFRSWGFCSQSTKEDLDYIIKIFNFDSIDYDITKKNEYRNYLMIITNNCNDYIEDNLPINKQLLEDKKKMLKKKNTITGYNDVDITIEDTTKLEIKFDSNDKSLTYKAVFNKWHLLNDEYNNTIFMISSEYYNNTPYYVIIKKNTDDEFDIINMKEPDIILNKEPFNIKTRYMDQHRSEYSISTLAFTSIAIINDNVKAVQYNKDHCQPGGGILSKNKGKKGVYKSTKQKISVIIDKKPCDRTVYKNAKGISYIRCNNEYKLLKKYKLVKK